MKWSDLIEHTAHRARRVPAPQVRTVLEAAMDTIVDALARGEHVTLQGVGSLHSSGAESHVLEWAPDTGETGVDRRYAAHFRPAMRLRDILRRRSQRQEHPAHLAAWRLAETLIDDLATSHPGLEPSLDTTVPEEIHRACIETFGPLWGRICWSYACHVPRHLHEAADYLALSARTRWAAQERLSRRA